MKQILSRFNDCDKLDFLSFLTPVSAYALSPVSLLQVYRQLPQLKDVADLEEADNEWWQHALCPNLNGGMSFLEYWTVVFKEKIQVGAKIYPNLTKLVATVLPLPFSNAAVEHVFSQLKLIKSDHRASLKQESLLTLLSTKYSFLKKGKRQAVMMDPSREMLDLHKRMKSNAKDGDAGKLRAEFLKELKNVKT